MDEQRQPLSPSPPYPPSIHEVSSEEEASHLYSNIASLPLSVWRERLALHPSYYAFWGTMLVPLIFGLSYFKIGSNTGWFVVLLYNFIAQVSPDFNPDDPKNRNATQLSAQIASAFIGVFLAIFLWGFCFYRTKAYFKERPSDPRRYERKEAIVKMFPFLSADVLAKTPSETIDQAFSRLNRIQANGRLNAFRHHISWLKLSLEARRGQRDANIFKTPFVDVAQRMRGEHDQRYDAMIRLVVNIIQSVVLKIPAAARGGASESMALTGPEQVSVRVLPTVSESEENKESHSPLPELKLSPYSPLSAAIELKEGHLGPFTLRPRAAETGEAKSTETPIEGELTLALPEAPNFSAILTATAALQTHLDALKIKPLSLQIPPGAHVSGTHPTDTFKSTAAGRVVPKGGVMAKVEEGTSASVMGRGMIEGRDTSPWYKDLERLIAKEGVSVEELISKLRTVGGDLNNQFAAILEKNSRAARGALKLLLNQFYSQNKEKKDALEVAYNNLQQGRPFDGEERLDYLSGRCDDLSQELQNHIRTTEQGFQAFHAELERFKTELAALSDLRPRVERLENYADQSAKAINGLLQFLQGFIANHGTSLQTITGYLSQLHAALAEIPAYTNQQLGRLRIELLTEIEGRYSHLIGDLNTLFADLVAALNQQLDRLHSNDQALETAIRTLVADLNNLLPRLIGELQDAVGNLYAHHHALQENLNNHETRLKKLEAERNRPRPAPPAVRSHVDFDPANYTHWPYLLMCVVRQEFDSPRGQTKANIQQRLRVLRYILEKVQESEGHILRQLFTALFQHWTQWESGRTTLVVTDTRAQEDTRNPCEGLTQLIQARHEDIDLLKAATIEEQCAVIHTLLKGEVFHQQLAFEIMGYAVLGFKERISLLAWLEQKEVNKALLKEPLNALLREAEHSFQISEALALVKLAALIHIKLLGCLRGAAQDLNAARAILRILAQDVALDPSTVPDVALGPLTVAVLRAEYAAVYSSSKTVEETKKAECAQRLRETLVAASLLSAAEMELSEKIETAFETLRDTFALKNQGSDFVKIKNTALGELVPSIVVTDSTVLETNENSSLFEAGGGTRYGSVGTVPPVLPPHQRGQLPRAGTTPNSGASRQLFVLQPAVSSKAAIIDLTPSDRKLVPIQHSLNAVKGWAPSRYRNTGVPPVTSKSGTSTWGKWFRRLWSLARTKTVDVSINNPVNRALATQRAVTINNPLNTVRVQQEEEKKSVPEVVRDNPLATATTRAAAAQLKEKKKERTAPAPVHPRMG